MKNGTTVQSLGDVSVKHGPTDAVSLNNGIQIGIGGRSVGGGDTRRLGCISRRIRIARQSDECVRNKL